MTKMIEMNQSAVGLSIMCRCSLHHSNIDELDKCIFPCTFLKCTFCKVALNQYVL